MNPTYNPVQDVESAIGPKSEKIKRVDYGWNGGLTE